MIDDLRALSVRQPWAHAIVHHGKDIENRSRRLTHRGPTLIHASATMRAGEYAAARDFMERQGLTPPPPMNRLRLGGIVGIVEVVGCVSAAENGDRLKWWIGPYGLVLKNARPLPFIECRGTVAPLFWKPDPATLDRVREAL